MTMVTEGVPMSCTPFDLNYGVKTTLYENVKITKYTNGSYMAINFIF